MQDKEERHERDRDEADIEGAAAWIGLLSPSAWKLACWRKPHLIRLEDCRGDVAHAHEKHKTHPVDLLLWDAEDVA